LHKQTIISNLMLLNH